MAIEALHVVRETEAGAMELRRNARAEARKIQEQAEAKGEAIVAEAIAEARQEVAEYLVQAEAEASTEVSPIHQRAREANARMEKVASGQLSEAVALIMERIVKADGRI